MEGSHPTEAAAPQIAVVDDDLSVRQSLHRLVRSLGYSVQTFATVEDFIESRTLISTQCLILDIQMPGLSGLDLQNILHALKTPIPIIFITGFIDDNVRAQAMRMGALGFLEKPFEEQALIQLLKKAMNAGGVS